MFENKFKDRSPEETIKIIKDFFARRNIKLDISENSSDIGTYSNMINASYKGIVILNSNGKGLTREFALASGLGELYERFCYRAFLTYDLFFENYNKQRIEDGLPVEEFKTYEELLDPPFIKEEMLTKTLTKEQVLKLCKTIPSVLTKRKWKDVLTEEEQYCSDFLESVVLDTTGVSAGNTFEEAFNQGMSEICERFCFSKMLKDKEFIPHFIDKKKIQNKVLQSKLQKIEEQNNDVYILDFSYNYSLPVVCLIIINRDWRTLRFCLGSFPVFDIALERCVTEIYQNLSRLDFCFTNYTPFRNFEQELNKKIKDASSKTDDCSFFNEKFFLEEKRFDINRNFYLHDKSNNIEIFEFYKKIIKLKNWKVCWTDYSLCKDFYSIKSVLWDTGNEIKNCYTNLPYPPSLILFADINKILRCFNELRKDLFGDFKDLDKLYSSYQSLKSLMSLFDKDNEILPFITFFSGGHFMCNPFHMGSLLYESDNFIDFFEDYGSMISDNLMSSLKREVITKYCLLYRFKSKGLYTKEEITALMQKFNHSFTDEDYENWNNNNYLVKKITLETMYDFVHSDTIKELYRTFYTDDELKTLKKTISQ